MRACDYSYARRHRQILMLVLRPYQENMLIYASFLFILRHVYRFFIWTHLFIGRGSSDLFERYKGGAHLVLIFFLRASIVIQEHDTNPCHDE